MKPFWIILFCAVLLPGSSVLADIDVPPSCKYEVMKKGRSFIDVAAMFRDAPMVVTARVADTTPLDEDGKGVIRLAISKVFKGRGDLSTIDIDYSRPLCTEVDCGGNNLPVAPIQYLFFLDRGRHGLATRVTCYNTAVNGWIEQGRVYFNEKFTVPWDDLPSFLTANESLVPQN